MTPMLPVLLRAPPIAADRDARPQLLRGGSARPSRGGGAGGGGSRGRRLLAAPAGGRAGAARSTGSRITRLDVQRHQGSPIATYLLEYADFTARSTFALARAHRRRRYGLVQVHTPPDFLVAAALPLRLLGVPVILDLHEAVPEFFRSRWPGLARNGAILAAWPPSSAPSIAMVTVALSVNQARHDRLVRMGVPAGRLRVVTNGPVLARFDPTAHPAARFMEDGTLRLAYAGALTPLYGLDDVLTAMAPTRDRRVPSSASSWTSTAGETSRNASWHGQPSSGWPIGSVSAAASPIDAVAGHLAAADIVLSPIRRTRFSEISLSTKAIEGAVMGKPVVAADMPTARHYFPGDDLAWYVPDDPAGMAAAILRLVDDAPARERGRGSRRRDRARPRLGPRGPRPTCRLVESFLRDRPIHLTLRRAGLAQPGRHREPAPDCRSHRPRLRRAPARDRVRGVGLPRRRRRREPRPGCRAARRHSPIDDITDERLRAALEAGLEVHLSADAPLAEAEAIFVCVPTPITDSKDPDLRPVLSAAETIRPVAARRPAHRPPVHHLPGNHHRPVPRGARA